LVIFRWQDLCQSLEDTVVDLNREVFIRGAIIRQRGDVFHPDNPLKGDDAPDHLQWRGGGDEARRGLSRNLKEEIEEWESGDEAVAGFCFELQGRLCCSIRVHETTSFVLCGHIHPPVRE
jgi:hypothetical protein